MSTDIDPKLEIRVLIGSSGRFYRQLHYLLESLRTFGGAVGQNAHCVAVVNPVVPRCDLASELTWSSDYSINFQWVDREQFQRRSYFAAGAQRFRVSSDADVVAFVDADIVVAGDLGHVVREVHQSQRLMGFIAHVSPFDTEQLRHIPSYQWWNWIFEEAGLTKPRLSSRQTGWGLMSRSPMHRCCPPYFNYGFVIAPRICFDRCAQTIDDELEAVDRVVHTEFKAQIALTLALSRNNTPWAPLSINYNFPLHVDGDRIRELNPDPDGRNAPSDVRVFHCLGHGEINPKHFDSASAISELLGREDLSPHGRVCQRKLAIVHERIAT